jgi:hypothetical protein
MSADYQRFKAVAGDFAGQLGNLFHRRAVG